MHTLSSAAALVVTEVYPPSLGGSGELMKNIYGRWGVTTTVLTHSPTAAPTRAIEGGLQVERENMRASDWGLLRPSSLRHHFRRAARLRGLSAPRPTVVHCCGVLPEGLDAWLASFRGSPYVCWAHGEELNVIASSRELRLLFHLVQRRASALIANSVNTATLLAQRGVGPSRIHTVRPGVDTDRFKPEVAGAAELRASLVHDGELLLLTVGRLQLRKGHDLVLKALAGLERSGPAVRYVVVGEGDQFDRLNALSTELGVRDRVEFVGHVPAGELPKYFAAADIFVHPNRMEVGDFEGFGMVFLEAAAAGLPVIGGDSGGVPEAVERNVTGLLVSGQSAAELRESLVTLCNDAARRQTMGRRGRLRAEQEFSWIRAAQRVNELHSQVAARAFAGR